MRPQQIVVYGDFNCPWSHLASRRAARLAADGLRVDWRAVEHDPRCSSRKRLPGPDVENLRTERDRVVALLLTDEELPDSLAGFVPCTGPATAGYAEAYGAGVAADARRLLFEAFWVHAIDLGDPRLVRTLLVDAIRSGSSSSESLREWGYAIDVTGAPITGLGHRLVDQWAAEWAGIGTGTGVVPVLVVDGGAPILGEAAVRWLGEELVSRRIDLEADLEVEARRLPAQRPARPDLPDLSWTTQQGSRWNRAYQDAHGAAMLRTV